MKRKPISKLICMALCFSMIAGSAGVVFANEEELLTAGSAGETYVEEFDSGDSFSEEMTPELMYTLGSDDDQELYILNEQEEYPAEEYLGFEEDSEIPESEEDLIIQEPEEDLEFADPAAEEQEKEAFVNSLFEAALAALDPALSEETDAYEKAAAIYSCVSLSFTDVEITDEELAELTGKLLEYYGLENVILSGLNEEGSPVYWNLVRIGEIFYNLDVSLDRAVTDRQEWKGFLRGSVSPFGYVRDGQYLTEEFLMGFPVAEEDYIPADQLTDHASGEELAPEDASDSEQVSEEAQDTASEPEAEADGTEEEEKSEDQEAAEAEDEEAKEEAVESEADEELNTASKGSSVWFGKYIQTRVKRDSTEDKVVYQAIGDKDKITLNGITYERDGWDYVRWDPIEWIVLGESNGYYKLLSKKVLRYWHFSGWDDNWKDSEMRYWLNSTASDGFMGKAFNKNEQADMNAVTVSTYDGRDAVWLSTKDKVTLLDERELSQVPASSMIAYASTYVNEDPTVKHRWWLRGDSGNSYGMRTQPYVTENGTVDGWYGTWDRGARPVIWVKTTSKYLYTKYPQDNAAAVKGAYPSKVKLNKTSYTLDQGDTFTLKATVTPSTALDKTVKWSSSNKKVATVTSGGKVKALTKGTATITAKTANGKKATCKITVTKYKAVTKVTLNKTSLTMNEGAAQTLKASAQPTKNTDPQFTWSSSNAKVATVDSKGKITAVSGGSATITVKSRNGKKATCKVTVKALSVQYRTHIQTYGWETKWAADGTMSGTEGQSKRLEGIYIRLANQGYSGDIQYRTHVQTYGWQAWKKNGQMAGTTGESKRLEAIQIKLTGDLAKKYDIYYRTHIQTFGWSGWAKNGEMCGSAGYSKRLEGINIKLVKKGGKAPGKTAAKFFDNTTKIKNTSTGSLNSSWYKNLVNGKKIEGIRFTDVEDLLAGSFIIPGLENTNQVYRNSSNMVPQGICFTGKYYVLSAYDGGGGSSCLYVLDAAGNYLKTLVLNSDTGNGVEASHVGALEFYQNNIYIADSSRSSDYRIWKLPVSDLDATLAQKDDAVVVNLRKNNSVKVATKPSCFTIYDNKMYVCNINRSDGDNPVKNSFMQAYDPATGKAVGSRMEIGKEVQGISMFNKGGQTYMVCSCSYGRENTGKLEIWNMNKKTKTKTYTLPNMCEDLTIRGGKAYVMFESAAKKYRSIWGDTRPLDRVLALNIKV